MAAPIQINPAITIIGNDLDAIATFNADLDPTAGMQKAGRFMSYDPATRMLTPWDGVADAPGATIWGVLADDVVEDVAGGQAEVTKAVMVYRGGTFLRQEIESANNAYIEAGGPLDTRLRDLGISLVYSYEGYQGLDPVPAGAQAAMDQQAKEGEERAKARAEKERQEKAKPGDKVKEEGPQAGPRQ